MTRPERVAEQTGRSGDPGRNLVVSAAFGYEPDALKPFLRSLHHYAPGCTPVLIGDRFTSEDRRVLRGFHPEVVFHEVIRSRWMYAVLRLAGDRLCPDVLRRGLAEGFRRVFEGSPNVLLNTVYVHHARFFYALDLLENKFPHAEKILLSDSRDVVFQDDPFAFDVSLASGLEDIAVGDSTYTLGWIRSIFGRETVRALRDRTVICSGVTLGHRDEILDYLEAMTRVTCDRFANLFGFNVTGDQAIHNVVLHREAPPEGTLLPNGNPWLATLHHADLDSGPLSFHPEHGVTGSGGEPVGILHQYDRKPALRNHVLERWGGTIA